MERHIRSFHDCCETPVMSLPFEFLGRSAVLNRTTYFLLEMKHLQARRKMWQKFDSARLILVGIDWKV